MAQTLEEYYAMVGKARAVQARQVMPLIGGLLDAWDCLSNDARASIKQEAPSLCDYLAKIEDGMCADIGDNADSSLTPTDKT